MKLIKIHMNTKKEILSLFEIMKKKKIPNNACMPKVCDKITTKAKIQEV